MKNDQIPVGKYRL